MAMRNKQKEKRLGQEERAVPGHRETEPFGELRTGRLRGWSSGSEEATAGTVNLKKSKRARHAVTTSLEHQLEEDGDFRAQGTHLGQPGTAEEPPKSRRRKHEVPPEVSGKEKRKAEKERKSKPSLKLKEKEKGKQPKTKPEDTKKEKSKKDKKKKKKDRGEYDPYAMMGQTMMPMMGMMRPMGYPMMPGMMMMPGMLAPPLMGHVGMGMHSMPYLPGVPLARPGKKPEAEAVRRRFTEAPKQEDEAGGSSSSSSSSSEPKEAGEQVQEAPEPVLGEENLGLVSPEKPDEELSEAPAQDHSPLQVPPGVESPVASPSESPKQNEDEGQADSQEPKPTTWVEVEGESMEDLQRELEVVGRPKPGISVETQTEEADIPEDCLDRYFSGFEDALPKAKGPEPEESSSSGESSSGKTPPTCRPQRKLRKLQSRSQSDEAPEPAEKAAAEEEESSSSSSSSSSPRQRQRVASSDEETAKPAASANEAPLPLDPRMRLRAMQDYSDVV